MIADLLDNLAGVIVSVSVVVSVAAFALVLLGRETVTNLRATNGDQRDRIVLLEASEMRLEARVAELEAENKLLRTMATGEVEVAAVKELLNSHHEESRAAWAKTAERLDEIRRAIERKPS